MLAAYLSIFFVINHYFVLAVLLTYWMRNFLMSLVGIQPQVDLPHEEELKEGLLTSRPRPVSM